ncbi:MAG TPA: methylated-DNA--[protein]-cysteine S-methyltransferase [Anaerolineales bacterium]|nr:methylated-DNA--[protein]-cysteine S-methyltransferase [Anaerolineales bacterium]
MTNYEQAAQDYQRVEQALYYLEANYLEQPGLKEVADHLHLSEYHFQKLFTRWAGISPKRFLQYLSKEHAKQLMAESASLLEAAYATGLSGPGRLHDLFITTEAVTPGEYRSRGAGLEIAYGFHPSPFGECLLAATSRGVCNLIFVEGGDRAAALADLRRRWGQASLVQRAVQTTSLVEQIFQPLAGGGQGSLALHLQGTNFQIKVWEALLRIPAGAVASYEQIAALIGRPRSARAVSNAIADNPLPVLIPCHRVIRKMGEFGGYRYGTARKKALLGREMASREAPAGQYLSLGAAA